MEDEDVELIQEELEALEQYGYSYPKEEDKLNVFSFFKRVISQRDNTRTANLLPDEIGNVRNSVRTFQELELYCRKLGLSGLSQYFQEKGQIVLGTSLSREGFLDKLAVTQKRETDTKLGRHQQTQNKGWFKKKQPMDV